MPKNDGLYLEANGEIVLIIDAKDYRLRRPTIREFRGYREAVLALSNRADTIVDEAESGIRTPLTPDERAEAEDRVLGWWVDVIDGLNGAAIDPADMPPWIMDRRNIPDVLSHWMTRPTVPGV